MSPQFELLVAENILSGLDAMISAAEFVNEAPYSVDLSAGKIDVGDQSVPVKVLGTWAKDPQNSWLWAWANPGWSDLPTETLSAAERLQKRGEIEDIPELVVSELPMDDDSFGFHVAAIACGMTGAHGALQHQHAGGSAFFILPHLSSGPSNDGARHLRVIAQGLEAYDVPHMVAIPSYLRQRGYSLNEHSSQKTIATRGNDIIELSFDGLSRLSNIEGKFGEGAPKNSSGFFSKLFKK